MNVSDISIINNENECDLILMGTNDSIEVISSNEGAQGGEKSGFVPFGSVEYIAIDAALFAFAICIVCFVCYQK